MSNHSHRETLLRRARQAKGLTHSQVAARINVTREAVVGWETGSAVAPLARLRQLAELYGLDATARAKLYAEGGYLAPELERALLAHPEQWHALLEQFRKAS